MKESPKIETPRPYLSYSSYVLFKKGYNNDHKEWKEVYLFGNRREFRTAQFGKDFAKSREDDEATNDRDINFARMMMPKYPNREQIIKVWGGVCDVLGRPDGRDDRSHVIADDKTTKIDHRSCPKCKAMDTKLEFTTNIVKILCQVCGHVSNQGYGWTQEKVDKHDQFTWYDYIQWKKTGKLYRNELNWYNFNTKEIRQFKTMRSIANDFLPLQADIRKVWGEIQIVSEKIYNSINL